uniref:Uncharacterized protein n=1 Tax=Ditylenchus dipsaci TaxID=166011 RepID=A0A915EG42_9BILA
MTEQSIDFSEQTAGLISTINEYDTKVQAIQNKIKKLEQTNEWKLSLESLVRQIASQNLKGEHAKEVIENLVQQYIESHLTHIHWANLNFAFFLHSFIEQFKSMQQLEDAFKNANQEIIDEIKELFPDFELEVRDFDQVEVIIRQFLEQIFDEFSTKKELETFVVRTINHYSQKYIGIPIMKTSLKNIFDTYYLLLQLITEKQWQHTLTTLKNYNEQKRELAENIEKQMQMRQKMLVKIDDWMKIMKNQLDFARRLSDNQKIRNEL